MAHSESDFSASGRDPLFSSVLPLDRLKAPSGLVGMVKSAAAG